MKKNKEFKLFSFDATVYNVVSIIISVLLTGLLIYSVAFLPAFGDPNAPTVNEVSREYVENGTKNTGAVNTVAAMILDYRAFDTFGEASMLYVATVAVISLMRKKTSKEGEDDSNEKLK